ncbi:hypothetical protein DAQ1742_04459 [Dickeya aquatica]|uniref:Uncharacterized protein n=1 Tax=Dickeya aquatica TaxID=1401087 RepID=A0A375AGI2_9GAMM|nr:hypothetical protein DAQ1742_04459 [Dickeya aquatica]
MQFLGVIIVSGDIESEDYFHSRVAKNSISALPDGCFLLFFVNDNKREI